MSDIHYISSDTPNRAVEVEVFGTTVHLWISNPLKGNEPLALAFLNPQKTRRLSNALNDAAREATFNATGKWEDTT